MEGGRHFGYEHPQSAASWNNPNVDKFAATVGVMRTELDQCKFGLTSEDELGRAPTKKPTSLLTSSVVVYRTMRVKCKEGHRCRFDHREVSAMGLAVSANARREADAKRKARRKRASQPPEGEAKWGKSRRLEREANPERQVKTSWNCPSLNANLQEQLRKAERICMQRRLVDDHRVGLTAGSPVQLKIHLCSHEDGL